MKLRFTYRRVLFWAFVAIAIICATVAIRHASKGQNVSASTLAAAVSKQAVPVPAPSFPQAEPGPARISVGQEPSNISLDDEEAFSSLAESEVSQLHESITLAQWMKLYGTNEGWVASTDENFFDCKTFAKSETLSSARTITRMAYFYPPEAPTPAVFPTAAGQMLIDRTCTLALIRVQTPTPANQDGRALAQALQQHLAKKYGDSIGMKGAVFGGAAAWLDAARWRNDSEIVSAYNPTQAGYDREDPNAGTVFVFARLPVVYEIEQNACCRMKAYRYRSIENAQFHQAIAMVGVGPSLTERVTHLYEVLFEASASSDQSKQPENTKLRDSVVPMLGQWLNAVKGLPPARRAAGLFIADRLFRAAIDESILVTGWRELWDKDQPELRLVLQRMGAEFAFDELGKSYNYAGNWLNEARELDPNGAIGQMAVLSALARGGAPNLGKATDQDIFHTVVADSEWLLSKNPDPATAAQIHFIIGDAYSDIVALAGGAQPDYGDPKEYLPEADSARKKALEHYRAGLAVDGTSENAKDAWLQAWHLSAGLLPTTRYVYIND